MTDIEKKLQLTRFLREENVKNQIKLKNREEILYGSGKPIHSPEQLPPVYGGHLSEFDNLEAMPVHSRHSSLGLRSVIAVFLFSAVVWFDRERTVIAGWPAAALIQDQLSISAEGKLIDFVSKFPYTLSDENRQDR